MEGKKKAPVIGKYGYRNKRMADGDKKGDPLFLSIELSFCPVCHRTYRKCTCDEKGK